MHSPTLRIWKLGKSLIRYFMPPLVRGLKACLNARASYRSNPAQVGARALCKSVFSEHASGFVGLRRSAQLREQPRVLQAKPKPQPL